MILLITALLLHPVHETIAEIEWNEKTKRFEVAMRLDAIDDQWIRRESKRELPNKAKNENSSDGQATTADRNLKLLPSFGRRQATRAVTATRKQPNTANGESGNWRLQYVKTHFLVTDREMETGEASKVFRQPRYHWLGIEEDRGHVWWYFEIEPAGGKRPDSLVNMMLFEKESDQANRVLLLGTKPSRTLIHTLKSPRHSLESDSQDVESN